MRTLEQLTPDAYDRWRVNSEFHRHEREFIVPCLPPHASRIADLGCGTGTWTRLLMQRYPSASVVGVDNAPAIIEFARRASSAKVAFMAADCCAMPDIPRCDLAISAMSADYIGFGCVARALAQTLTDEGTALVWLLDPTRYALVDGRRRKEWLVDGQRVTVEVPAFDPDSVMQTFAESGLHASATSFSFGLADGITRVLICYRIRRETA